MASPEIIASTPVINKPVTDHLLPEVLDFYDTFGTTRSAAINYVSLIVARQSRKLQGVGPRPLHEFAALLGFEADLPPEYEYTAKERERFRLESLKMVGAHYPKVEQLVEPQVEQLVEPQVEQLVEPQVEQLVEPQVEQLDVVCSKLLYLQHFPRPNRSNFDFSSAAHPQELENRSRKLSQLVAKAKETCRSSLERVAKFATPETPTIDLETDLEASIDFYGFRAETAGKKRLWRDLS